MREARQDAAARPCAGCSPAETTPAAPVEKPAADESAVESSLIGQFLGGVEIIPEKSTRLVEIVYTSSSPEFAALAATTLAEEYAQQNIDLRLETINKNLLWLGDEVGQAGKEGDRSRDGDDAATASSRTRSRSRIARTSSSRG